MANSLADLYMRGGQARANTVLSLADIAANAEQQKAANWGQALGRVGQIATAVPGQIEQAKDAQFQREVVNEQRAAKRQAGVDQARVNQIISGFQTDPATGARTIPRDKLQALFAQENIPLDLQSQTFKALDDVDTSVQSFAKARMMASADLASRVLASGVDLDDPQAVELAMALGIGNGIADPSIIPQYNDAIAKGMTPKAFFEYVRGLDPKHAPKLQAVSPESNIVDMTTGQVVTPGTPKPVEPKMYPVTVDDGRGHPVEKLFTAEQLQQGVPAYRAPNKPDTEPLMAIMGPDNQPVYVPRSQAIGKRPANNREQGRPLTSGDANRIADLDTSLNDLKTMRAELSTVAGTTGTSAKVGAMLPNAVTDLTGWGTTAKQKQAVIDRVKQVIGKALEGGVLRKEDEIKYEKILPTIGDTAAVAKAKLDGLEAALKQRRETSLDAYEDAGYEVSRYRSRTPALQNIGRFQVVVE